MHAGSLETLSPAAGLETRNFRNQAENYAKEKPSAATKTSSGIVVGIIVFILVGSSENDTLVPKKLQVDVPRCIQKDTLYINNVKQKSF